MAKFQTGPYGILMNTTNTKQIWMKDGVRTDVSLNVPTKKKGKNFKDGHRCMECDKPRTIRGKLCFECRKKILIEIEKEERKITRKRKETV